MRAADGIEVHGEADVIGNKDELDHAAALQEVRCIADREDIGIAEDCKIFAQVVTFCCADEYNFAGFCAGYIREVSDMDWDTINGGVHGESVEG